MTNYIKHPNPLYRGNPLIEALGYPLTLSELVKKSRIPYQGDLDLSDTPQEYHGYYQRTAIDNLIRFHEPRDEIYRLYDIQRRMIESGLVNRNPLMASKGDKNGIKLMELLNAIQNDLDDSLSNSKGKSTKNNWIQSINVRKFGFHEVDHSFVFASLSGNGKTTMIENINKCEEMVIVHTEYIDHQGIKHKLPMKQIYKLYLKLDNRKGQKSTLLSILESVDALIDTNYAQINANSDVRHLIAAVRKIAVIHGIGLIIFDEAQNLSNPAKTDTIGSNERVSMKFLEEIFNNIAVPTFFIGTFSMLSLFSREGTIARRAGKDGSLLIASCEKDSPFWNRFCKILFQTKFLGNQRTSFDEFKYHIHFLSAGLPAIAVSLTRATLNFLTYLDPKNQDLSITALDKIYKEQFEILHGPLTALRSGKFGDYEDLTPMYKLERLESQLKKGFERLNKIDHVDSLLVGPVTIKQDHRSSKSDPELETKLAELSKAMNPDALLANLDSENKERNR